VTDNEQTRYPRGADQQLLESEHRRAIEEHERRFREDHEAFLRNSELKAQALNPVIDLLGATREEVESAVAEQYRANRDLVRRIQLPPFEPPTGHNPTRYPPYDFSWSGINCGGIDACQLYGPNAATGEVGADLFTSTAGGASSGAYVGDWFYSQSEDTWAASVQAYVYGVGYIAAAFGYASAYAGLQLFIRDHSTGDVYVTTTDIYNKSADVFGFDVTQFNGQTYTAFRSIPVHANAWYEVWGGAVQHAYAGGAAADALSSFGMWISPIAANSFIIF